MKYKITFKYRYGIDYVYCNEYKVDDNNWAGGPIGAYLSKDRARSVNMSEGVLTDDYATQVLNSDPIKGVFTIVGPDIPVKSVFGGSGMYDVSPKKLYNPFLSLTMMGMLGYKHLNKDE